MDWAVPMSMFDYDARPVTLLPVIVGTAASRGAYAIRDFLSRNGYPFEWVEPSALPLCIRGVGICGIWSVPGEVWPRS